MTVLSGLCGIIAVMTATEIQWAWAAGLFEGEGSFSRMKGRLRPIMEMSMTDEDVIRRFHTIVGVGGVTARNRYKTWPDHYKSQFRWYCGSWDAVSLVTRRFWPWFGQRRQDRFIELVMEGWADRSPERPFKIHYRAPISHWSDLSGRWVYYRPWNPVTRKYGKVVMPDAGQRIF